MPKYSKKQLLDQIAKNVKVCKKCRLCKAALNGVPGEGDFDSDIVFIGEAPGANEDKTGRPFVGRAGNLLEQSLSDIGYKREQVWIGNIIKHRPPQNRDPLADEISACAPYLTMQLKILKPRLIVTLGRFALNYFYPEGKISRDRGRLIQLKYNIFPVYHPAAALRNGNMRQKYMDDMNAIPEVLKSIEKLDNVDTNDKFKTTNVKIGLFKND